MEKNDRTIFIGIYNLAEDTPEPETAAFSAAFYEAGRLTGMGALAGKIRMNVPKKPLDKLCTEYEVVWGEKIPNLARKTVFVKLTPGTNAKKPGPREFSMAFKKIKALIDEGAMAGEDTVQISESHQSDTDYTKYDLEWGEYFPPG